MGTLDRAGVVRLAEARALIPGPAGEHSASVLRRGTLDVRLSLPVLPNQQTPHAQDEVYVIVSGKGVLCHDGRREPFEAGDLVFVAAGADHHFEEFGDDLAVWVVFFGPQGGEVSGVRAGEARAAGARPTEPAGGAAAPRG
jgi:mannose-6-phosphate isomerase-like protein (cupin superfamily)